MTDDYFCIAEVFGIATRLQERIDTHHSTSVSPLAGKELLQNILVQHLKNHSPDLAVVQFFEFAFELFHEFSSLDVLASDNTDGLQNAEVHFLIHRFY